MNASINMSSGFPSFSIPCHFSGGDKVAYFKQAVQTGKFKPIQCVIPQLYTAFLYPVMLSAKFFLLSNSLCNGTIQGHLLYI